MDIHKIIQKAISSLNKNKGTDLVILSIEDNYGFDCASRTDIWDNKTGVSQSFYFRNAIFEDPRDKSEPEGFTQSGIAMLRIAKSIYDVVKTWKREEVIQNMDEWGWGYGQSTGNYSGNTGTYINANSTMNTSTMAYPNNQTTWQVWHDYSNDANAYDDLDAKVESVRMRNEYLEQKLQDIYKKLDIDDLFDENN